MSRVIGRVYDDSTREGRTMGLEQATDWLGELVGRKPISRKSFLKLGVASALASAVSWPLTKIAEAAADESTGRVARGAEAAYDLVVAESADSYANTVKVVEAMGGMKTFVRKNDTVVVKPNMAWDRTPEQAANTDPQVVAALVQMSYDAGAKKVKVFDVPCNEERRVHESSGIRKAAEAKGANVFYVDLWNIVKAKFANPSSMEGWPILRDAVSADVFINAPVLKHHALTGLTLSMKNLMGICAGKRGQIHWDIGPKLADLTSFIKPDLTVIDATRVLMRHGPSGGDVADVKTFNKVFASTDPVLADTYACRLMEKDPLSVPYLKAARERGMGRWDLEAARIHVVGS
ncbi:MAG: DUF362 domain-containing protein [Candidatus Omnitrophica bacterium]|nr:DUF362 domain-containing protein [Candidatus Omnitrophota bacterium]